MNNNEDAKISEDLARENAKLRMKVKDLEDINNKLTNEIYCLRATLRTKGIL